VRRVLQGIADDRKAMRAATCWKNNSRPPCATGAPLAALADQVIAAVESLDARRPARGLVNACWGRKATMPQLFALLPEDARATAARLVHAGADGARMQAPECPQQRIMPNNTASCSACCMARKIRMRQADFLTTRATAATPSTAAASRAEQYARHRCHASGGGFGSVFRQCRAVARFIEQGGGSATA
jgi:hypothetical protein